ncbi:unnamed protein product [Prunus armeniaca]
MPKKERESSEKGKRVFWRQTDGWSLERRVREGHYEASCMGVRNKFKAHNVGVTDGLTLWVLPTGDDKAPLSVPKLLGSNRRLGGSSPWLWSHRISIL